MANNVDLFDKLGSESAAALYSYVDALMTRQAAEADAKALEPLNHLRLDILDLGRNPEQAWERWSHYWDRALDLSRHA